MAEQSSTFKDSQRQPADILAELLIVNQEMAKELKFLRNYFRWQAIWSATKWVILVLVIILGLVSLKTLANYFQSYTDIFKTYSNQLESAGQQTNSLKNQ